MVRAVAGHAVDGALTELCWSCAATAMDSELARLRRVGQLLPADVPEDLLAVAMDICGDPDLDRPFELGLDLMLRGLDPA